ncbi:MAG: hypothetical protein ACN6RD_02415 [Stenotrophomonas maltophilia]
MSWGHAALELDEDADERTVKRAYARRLRSTRPDDDPAAFQQLHEAYQAALEWARYRAQWQAEDDDDGDDGQALSGPAATGVAQALQLDQALAGVASQDNAPAPPGGAEPDARDPARILDSAHTQYPDAPPRAPVAAPPHAAATPARVDPDAFAREVIEQAQQCEPDAFERWLQLRPELWSLQDKPLIGDAVLSVLLSSELPLYIGNFDLLSQCFRWNEVGSGLDPYVADECRLRLHRLWVLQPRNHAALGRFLHRDGVPLAPEKARVQLDRLTRPWSRWQALWSAVWTDRVSDMRATLARLGIDDASDAPPPLQRQQVAFWLALADRSRLGWARLQLALLRSTLVAATLVAAAPLLGVLTNLTPTGRSGGVVAPQGVLEFTRMGLIAAAAVVVLGTLLPAVRAIAQWQAADEDPSARWRRLKLWLVPLLAVSAVLLIHLADARIAGSALAWLTLGIAVRRWWVRGGYAFKFNGWLLLAMWPFLKLMGLALLFGEIAVVGALLAWAVDAMTQVVHR